MPKRDWDSPEYREFRAKVRKRDKCCQMPRCKSRKALKVHHILTWAKYPHLRFDVRNGILLCRACHDSISKKENYFARLFMAIVRQKYDN